MEKILRHVGFISLDGVQWLAGVLMLAPDLVMLITSIVIYFVIRQVNVKPNRATLDHAPPSAVVGGFSFVATKSWSKFLILPGVFLISLKVNTSRCCCCL